MEPALNRFKNMTELVILVASFLDRDDLASIRLTCHYINSICIPFFYRNVELNPPWQRWTTDGTRGLARHFSFVRLLRTDERSCFNYYLRLVEVFYNPTVGTSPSDSTTVQTDDSTSSLHMTIPTALDLILPKNLLDTLCEKRFIPAILSYVVAFSPHLTVLELNEIHIDAKFELQILARVLSGIGTLQSLTMEIFSTRVEPEDALTTVFYSCPPLVKYFSFYYKRGSYRAFCPLRVFFETSREPGPTEHATDVVGGFPRAQGALETIDGLEAQYPLHAN